jgi:MerR family copper efflux transcriptional regulator
MDRLKVGELACRAGVGVQTVRFYERKGLIEPPPRTHSGYRQYPESAVARIRFIQRAQRLGFSLAEVDELLSLRVDPSNDRGAVRTRAAAKLEEIREKVRDLERIETALADLIDACSGRGGSDACPILEALEPDSRRVVALRATAK